MLDLNLGTALLIWTLIGTLAHEYGHSFIAKIYGCKTIGFFASPIPGVLPQSPTQKKHAILILAGGWIFGVVSIVLFLPLVASEYIVPFLITALVIETILSGMSDFVGIVAWCFAEYKAKDWSKWLQGVVKDHNKMAKYGLSKMVIVNRKLYEESLRESMQHQHSIAFLDKLDFKGWMVLLSLLALASALMVSLVNWPVFWLLRRFGVEVIADFSILFWALLGIAFILTIIERLILHYYKK